MLKALGLGMVLAMSASTIALAQDAPAEKPNILVIFGDDIGQTNLSIYSHGPDGLSHAQHRPDRHGRRLLHRLLRRAELHRRPLDLHHRPGDAAYRPLQGRPARRRHRPAGQRRHHRLGAQGPRLRHRPVRQEPPRRQGRVPADQPRLRRVLRQPLPPERRGGAGELQLPAGPGLPRAVRPARRHQGLRRRQDRGHRPADPQAHGDRRRRDLRRRHRLHPAPGRRRYAVLHLDEHHADALPHPRAPGAPQPARA